MTCGSGMTCRGTECTGSGRGASDGSGEVISGSGGVAQVCTDWTDWERTNTTQNMITECLDDGRCRNCSDVTFRRYCIYIDNKKKAIDYGHSKKEIRHLCDDYPPECEYVYNRTETRYKYSRGKCKPCNDTISIWTCKYRNEIYPDNYTNVTECSRTSIDCPEDYVPDTSSSSRSRSRDDEDTVDESKYEHLAKSADSSTESRSRDRDEDDEKDPRSSSRRDSASKYKNTTDNDDLLSRYGIVGVVGVTLLIVVILFAFYKMFLSKPPE